jgi:uncharacterized repeat protein (TIGR02543 family)
MLIFGYLGGILKIVLKSQQHNPELLSRQLSCIIFLLVLIPLFYSFLKHVAEFPRQVIITLLAIGAGCLLFSQRVVGASNLAVEVTVLGEGVVNGSGSYSSGNTVNLTAEAKPGYVFKGWSGDLAGKENPYVFEIRSAIKAKAHFQPVDSKIIYVNGQPALAGSFVAKLNETGRRLLKRRSNRVGNTRVYRRNKVLDDLVSIEWDSDAKLSDSIMAQNLSANALKEVSEKKSALKSQGVERQIKEMMDSGNYEFVEPDWLVGIDALPTDSAFTDGKLWGLRNTGQAGMDIQAVEAWDITKGSNEIVVAVIDTGVRYTHKDLAANMWENPGEIAGNGRDDDGNEYVDDVHGINAIRNSGDPKDDHGHGTHVAGTIGAVANGGGAAVGVAWNVKIMALKFLPAHGLGSYSNAIECIDYAIANGADVMNNSWGGGPSDRSLRTAIDRARSAGIVFVAAAGNGGRDQIGDDNDNFKHHYPSDYSLDNIISVAAVNRHGNLAGFSNYGRTSVDLAAPGVSIYSTYYKSDTSYTTLQGTSMAAPHVSGAVALLLSREPDLTPSQVRQRLIDTAEPLQTLRNKVVSGGMLDAHAALLAAPRQALNLEVTYSPEVPAKDESFYISARVSSPQPVTGATVQAIMANGVAYNLLDNGLGDDAKAGDGIYSVVAGTPTLATFELTVTASAQGFLSATSILPVKTIFRPSNDDFANPLPLPSNRQKTSGDNTHATVQSFEPLFERGVTGTVWYSWLPGQTGRARLSTFGSSFDTTLAVYQGGSLSSLVPIASNDDHNDLQFTSEVTFDAQKDKRYLVQVGGMRGLSGGFQIKHPQPTPKDDDDDIVKIIPPKILTKPIDLSKIEGDSIELVVKATGTEPLEYQWTLNGGKLTGAVQSSYSLPRITLEDYGLYSVMVTNKARAAFGDIADLTVRETKEKAPNDDVENAAILIGEEGSRSVFTRNATGQTGEPDHAVASAPLHSVWWKWTAPRSGKLRLDTKGSSFDTTLAAYRLVPEGGERRSRSNSPGPAPRLAPATKDAPAVVTLPGHGFSTGDRVRITGLVGHASESAAFLITVLNPNAFRLEGTKGASGLTLSPESKVNKP